MTSEFKENILSWLAGNYQVESPGTSINWSTTTTKENDLYTFLQFGETQGYQINGQIQSQGYVILYGEYGTYPYYQKGFIVILDDKYTPLQKITQYKSGSDLNAIKNMGIDENNLFFMVEQVGTTQFRFCMLNNFLVKLSTNFEVILRTSYFLPSSYTPTTINSYSITNLEKVPGQAIYLFAFSLYSDSQYIDVYPTVLEFKINVGSTNEWIEHKGSVAGTNINQDLYCTYSNNATNFRLSYVAYSGSTGTTKELVYNGSTLTINTYNSSLAITYENNTLAYGVASDFSEAGYVTFSISSINLTSQTVTQLWSYRTAYTSMSLRDIVGIYIHKIENEVFCEYIYGTDADNYSYNIGRISNNQVFTHNAGTFDATSGILLNLFSVSKLYNLYNYYIQGGEYVYNVKQIYNSNSYNGASYKALNSMVPNSANLYDSNGVAIFSRNLYNRVVNNSTTTSTVQVPNQYLNGINIKNKNLISEVNNILVSDSSVITTNIYEELLINFINTLIMKNSNNPNNIIINSTGSNRLNNSISTQKDYSNAKMGKYKINYADNTTAIFSNNWVPIGNYFRTYITIYVSKAITSIDLISNDENTTYCTITGTFTIGNFYNIEQDVYIDEKIEPNKVYYSQEEVYYGTEKVYF